MMTILLTAFFVLFLTQGCQGQLKQSARLVGRPCEGCEAIFEYGEIKNYRLVIPYLILMIMVLN
jgi:hypothetical protein